MSHRKNSQSGYTLVEIAIVLVIIGLLLGGVLKGQELIYNQKVKSTYDNYRQYTAAMYGYQDRYKALPGDDAAATTRGFIVQAGDPAITRLLPIRSAINPTAGAASAMPIVVALTVRLTSNLPAPNSRVNSGNSVCVA